jgi:Carboxymuconolactone decarboxylase family
MAQSQPASARDAVRNVVPDLIGYTEKWLFGEVWERPQLSKRDRSLIVVATLIALGREKQLVGHLERALQNGLSKNGTQRSDHPPRLLCRLAGGDDRGPRRQGRVRKELSALTFPRLPRGPLPSPASRERVRLAGARRVRVETTMIGDMT